MTNIPQHIRNTDRLSKLPAWAQDLIKDLDRKVTEAREDRDELVETIGKPQSTVGGRLTAIRVPRGIYLHAASDSWTDTVRVRFDEDRLEVTGNGPLTIRTTASNAITVSEAGR